MTPHISKDKDEEVNLLHQGKIRKNEHGQIFVVLAFIIPILIVFIGLSIDLGRAYITRTTLSKAVDAAALAAMRNLNVQGGQTEAAVLAKNAFNANYQSVPGLGTTPVPTVIWSTDKNGNTLVTISATATINAYFLQLLGSSYRTLNISESAQAVRNPLVMSLVLDRSGSMNNNGGAQALPTAVTDFISYFDEGVDNVAEISFSSVDSVDVAMTTSFQAPINSAVEGMQFTGATFAQAGLQDGFSQILSKPVQPNIIRVAVFFTDGWANTNGLAPGSTGSTGSTTHDFLNCTGGNPPTSRNPASTTYVNYGGCAPLEAKAGWCGNGSSDTEMFYMNPSTGATASCPNGTGEPPALTFPVEAPGVSNALTQQNVTLDATYRTTQLAATMRNTTNNITIYSIGLGNKINTTYLQEMANDPAADTYDPNQPVGEAVFAPNASQLEGVFQTIASKILLRLSQ